MKRNLKYIEVATQRYIFHKFIEALIRVVKIWFKFHKFLIYYSNGIKILLYDSIVMRNFTDSGLINFGKSLENLPALNSISLRFSISN